MSAPSFYDFFLNWKIKIHGGAIILIHPVQPLHTMSGDRLKDTICNSRFYYFNIYGYIYQQRSQQRSMCVYIYTHIHMYMYSICVYIYTQPKPKGRHLFSMMGRIRGDTFSFCLNSSTKLLELYALLMGVSSSLGLKDTL